MADLFDESTTSSINITELSGEKRVIVLDGRAKPFRPFSFAGEQRYEKTIYPGNPTATIQMLGSAEQESTWKGRWSDRYTKMTAADGTFGLVGALLSPGPVLTPECIAKVNEIQVDSVMSLVTLFEDVRRQGQLLQVTWAQITRLGVLKSCKWDWDREEICNWEMTFDWISQGDKQPPIGLTAPPDLLSILTSLINSLIEYFVLEFSILSDLLSDMKSIINKIIASIQSISDTYEAIRNAVLLPYNAYKLISSGLDDIRDSCRELMDKIESKPYRAWMLSNDISSLSFGDSLTAVYYFRNIYTVTKALRAIAASQKVDLKTSGDDQETSDVYFSVDNRDLRQVSMQYYGTIDNWKKIMEFNDLTSSELHAGMMVLIP